MCSKASATLSAVIVYIDGSLEYSVQCTSGGYVMEDDSIRLSWRGGDAGGVAGRPPGGHSGMCLFGMAAGVPRDDVLSDRYGGGVGERLGTCMFGALATAAVMLTGCTVDDQCAVEGTQRETTWLTSKTSRRLEGTDARCWSRLVQSFLVRTRCNGQIQVEVRGARCGAKGACPWPGEGCSARCWTAGQLVSIHIHPRHIGLSNPPGENGDEQLGCCVEQQHESRGEKALSRAPTLLRAGDTSQRAMAGTQGILIRWARQGGFSVWWEGGRRRKEGRRGARDVNVVVAQNIAGVLWLSLVVITPLSYSHPQHVDNAPV